MLMILREEKFNITRINVNLVKLSGFTFRPTALTVRSQQSNPKGLSEADTEGLGQATIPYIQMILPSCHYITHLHRRLS